MRLELGLGRGPRAGAERHDAIGLAQAEHRPRIVERAARDEQDLVVCALGAVELRAVDRRDRVVVGGQVVVAAVEPDGPSRRLQLRQQRVGHLRDRRLVERHEGDRRGP